MNIFTDGATVGHNGKLGTVKEVSLGVYMEDTDRRYSKLVKGISNNEAEFKALIWAMEMCVDQGHTNVQFYSDSTIVVNRANNKKKVGSGKGKFKNERMDNFQIRVLELKDKIGKVSFQWIPREQNTIADELSKKPIKGEVNNSRREVDISNTQVCKFMEVLEDIADPRLSELWEILNKLKST